jgi:hypothetical protein
MNAFISHSISENEQYILSLLAQKVAESGLSLVASYNQSDTPDFQTANEIKNSAVFIGLITSSGRTAKASRVYAEFKQAQLFNRPAILLIEDVVRVPLWVTTYQNTIRFSRYNIGQAIEAVNTRIKASNNPQSSQAAAWILGGLAALALLSLLSSDNK